MHTHPLIHSELARQRERELRNAGTRSRALQAQDSELAAVVRNAAAGDGQAWETLVNRFTPTLRGVVRGYRLSAADVEDVVQTAWTSAFAHIDRLREPEAIGSWLLVIGRREALRAIERRRREVPVDEHENIGESRDPAPDGAMIHAEQSRAVHDALERLPERQRSLLRSLMHNPDMSYADIAGVLGMPVGSIGPTRERALAVLRRDRRLADLAFPGNV
jgi:RNA polymerase sigma factor (sigma-70 family)